MASACGPRAIPSHSTSPSPWRAAKGDLVREVGRCRAGAGRQIGRLSFASGLYSFGTNPKNPAATRPTAAAMCFRSSPPSGEFQEQSRKRPHARAGVSRSTPTGVDDYIRYFPEPGLRVAEEYGPISESGSDGATSDPASMDLQITRHGMILIRKPCSQSPSSWAKRRDWCAVAAMKVAWAAPQNRSVIPLASRRYIQLAG